MGSARHARRDLLRQSGRGNAQQTIPTRRRIRRQSRHLPLRGTTPTPSDLARRMRRAHAVHLTQSARNRGTFPTPSHHPAGGRRHRAQPASRNQLVQNLTHRAGRLRTRLRGHPPPAAGRTGTKPIRGRLQSLRNRKNQSQRNRLRRHPAHHLPPHRKRRRRGGQHPLRHHMAHRRRIPRCLAPAASAAHPMAR